MRCGKPRPMRLPTSMVQEAELIGEVHWLKLKVATLEQALAEVEAMLVDSEEDRRS